MKKDKQDIVLITIFALLTTLSFCFQKNILFCLCFFLIAEVIIYCVWDKIKIEKKENFTLRKWEWFFYGGFISLVLLVSVIAYYPGFAYPDTISQWNQVQLGRYDNWHPVLHTLFSFTLPSLFYKEILSCTIFQCIQIGIILLYFCYFCRKNFFGFKMTLFILLTILLNPLFIKYSVTLLKDTPFSWYMFLQVLFLIEIVYTNGEWLKIRKNRVFFIFSSVAILSFRHNGIVPFLFVFLSLILFYPNIRKFALRSFLIILFSFLFITKPIYYYAHVGKINGGGKNEMVGMIMGNISYYYNHDVSFKEEELQMLQSLAPLEIWTSKYNPRNFNYIKGNATNYTINLRNNFNGILKMWFKKSVEHPGLFLNSFLNMSSPIWAMETSFHDVDYVVKDYQTSITQKGNMKKISNLFLKNVVKYYQKATYSFLRLLFINVGEGLLLIMFSFLLTVKKAKTDFKKYLPFVAVLTNSLVMILLITGEEYRFVYYQTICAVPLLLFSLTNIKSIDKNIEKRRAIL